MPSCDSPDRMARRAGSRSVVPQRLAVVADQDVEPQRVGVELGVEGQAQDPPGRGVGGHHAPEVVDDHALVQRLDDGPALRLAVPQIIFGRRAREAVRPGWPPLGARL